MMIYDGLAEMRKSGMNSTSFVFVNMISSSFLIQPIMNKHVCNDNKRSKLLVQCLISYEYNGLPCVPTCYKIGCDVV